MNTKDKYLDIVLNDQGGAVMNVTEGKTGTLRAQMGGHMPVVLERQLEANESKRRENAVLHAEN